ncbi:hypothetical protein DSO57_1033500 [Entomophthora muscae]|uniref:Uncharacterized protein n=1 Tax=Entomophthora muscae TaxID=34485 RepID=A0ACC2SD28_9FUNG|nr:hypothetical protein DSO57_1033500 [Entomophthora muscae]
MLKQQLKIPWSGIKLVTFGQPQVGNKAFANWMNSQASTHLCVVNNRNKAPMYPLHNGLCTSPPGILLGWYDH